jgi:hypothetical protein
VVLAGGFENGTGGLSCGLSVLTGGLVVFGLFTLNPEREHPSIFSLKSIARIQILIHKMRLRMRIICWFGCCFPPAEEQVEETKEEPR